MNITLATIKSFIRKNQGKLYIRNQSDFDGMVDCVMPCRNGGFRPVVSTEDNVRNSLGISGAWFVTRSRDDFQAYKDDDFTGFSIYNCCGSFVLAVREACFVVGLHEFRGKEAEELQKHIIKD